VAATAFMVLAVVLLVLLGLFALTALRWRPLIPFAVALAVLVIALWWSSVVVLGLSLLALVPVSFVVAHGLRAGKINAAHAGVFMHDRLEMVRLGRDGNTPPAKSEATLAGLLYPFRTGEAIPQGLAGILIRGAADVVAELSDADEPPFFKHILRADVDVRGGDDCDRRLTLRCFGVTGFASEEKDPPLEDEVTIDFFSRERWEAAHPRRARAPLRN
jgi:hypothetical protein